MNLCSILSFFTEFICEEITFNYVGKINMDIFMECIWSRWEKKPERQFQREETGISSVLTCVILIYHNTQIITCLTTLENQGRCTNYARHI